jgi:putative GTP pyrophosphokinase
MSFKKLKPLYDKAAINKAGQVLANPESFSMHDYERASQVLANFRACHGYPMNTFQMTLRDKLENISKDALVAQRLKRAPSIISKLQRFESMRLFQMQDIAGLRAVLENVKKVRKLERSYKEAKFKHIAKGFKDYIANPKADGYRGIHMIYEYRSDRAPEYNGLQLELQIRTKIQHAWATAVETMGAYLSQALKSGQGEEIWRSFFTKASAALAIIERTTPIPGFENVPRLQLFRDVAETEFKYQPLEKLRRFAIATGGIDYQRGLGAYHLVVLDLKVRAVRITPFPSSRLDEANREYAKIEQRTRNGERVEAVLVSAGPIERLKKAYPNYFLDTHQFIEMMETVIQKSRLKRPKPKKPIDETALFPFMK